MIISVTKNKLLILAKENKAASIEPFTFNEASAIKTYISSYNGNPTALLYVDANNNYYLEERDK